MGGDLWSFDGWHVAKSLADKYPDVFVVKGDNMGSDEVLKKREVLDPTFRPRYSHPEFVPEEGQAAAGQAEKSESESEAASDEISVGYHILGAAASIRRQKRYEQLAEQMKEEFQGSKQNLDAALGLIDALNGKKTTASAENARNGKKGENQKKGANGSSQKGGKGGSEAEPSYRDDIIIAAAGFAVSVTFGLLYRANQKPKWRPSKGYVEKELKRL